MPGSTAALPIQYRERTTTMFINRTTSRACGPGAPATHGDPGSGGGDRHEATGSDRGARCAVVRAGRGGDGLPGAGRPGAQMAAPGGPPFTLPALYCGFKLRVSFPVNHEYTKVLHHADGSTTFLFTGAVTASTQTYKQ